MPLHVGLFVYLLVKSCSFGLGAVAYPLDDTGTQSRTIMVCTSYGVDQTMQVYTHELVHACLHNHRHKFKTKQELQDHISKIPEQSEEGLVSTLAVCLTQPLGDKDALEFLGLSQGSDIRSSGRKMLSTTSQVNFAGQSRSNSSKDSVR